MPLHTIPLCSLNYVGDTLSGATFKYDIRENINKKNTDVKILKTETEIGKTTLESFCDNYIEKEIIKEDLLEINKNNVDINKFKNKNLLRINKNEISNKYEKQLDRDTIYKLDNSNKIINVKNISIIKDINIDPNINLEIINHNKLDKTECIYLDKEKEKGLDTTLNDKYVDISIIKDMDIKYNIFNIDRVNMKKIDILTNFYLDREKKKEIIYFINSNLVYKINNFRLTKYNYTTIEKNNMKNITRFIDTKLFYINTLKRIFKTNNVLGLNKEVIIRLSKHKSIDLIKDNIIEIFKSNSNSLEKYIKLKRISKFDTLGLNKDIFYRISNNSEFKELNKPNPNIYIPCEVKGLNKPKTYIYIPYAITDLEVIKRWWVLEATEPYDKKILPYDYNYLNNPLWINRRDREYGCLIDQCKHPISFMPYIENNKGIDLGYGLEEINLSIEIMIDMLNIVGMIVQHSASQFVNASGQETIEFITEVLLEWLNLDTTVQEMNIKGSREHCLRTYRWIRWEAEKVWFIADKDHSIDKSMGLKYANMLLANLIDYMKFHHFDIVPLWRNSKYMDIERQFNRKATNGDIIKDLDKLKGKRHYYIETQIFKRRI